jgi:hypothetical protein
LRHGRAPALPAMVKRSRWRSVRPRGLTNSGKDGWNGRLREVREKVAKLWTWAGER